VTGQPPARRRRRKTQSEANPRRGLPHLDAAEALYRQFGTGRDILLKEVDAYLVSIGAICADASDIERTILRGSWREKVVKASTMPTMRDRDVEPYTIICHTRDKEHYWRLEVTSKAVQRNRTLNKIASQTRRCSQEQRYYKESIDRDEDPMAYMQASVDLSFTEVMEELAGVALKGALQIGEKNRQEFALLQQGQAALQAVAQGNGVS
jgi:hypothetical protein